MVFSNFIYKNLKTIDIMSSTKIAICWLGEVYRFRLLQRSWMSRHTPCAVTDTVDQVLA